MPDEHLANVAVEQTVKEANIFALDADYAKTLLLFESVECIDESAVKAIIGGVEQLSHLIQHMYVLNGQRRLLVVAKLAESVTVLQELVPKELAIQLKRVEIPFTSPHVPPVLLVGEIGEFQLKLLNSDDKNAALKSIEAKTGLRLKKVKKTFYFSGLLFQFVILNELLEQSSKIEKIQVEAPSEPTRPVNHGCIDWRTLYDESAVKGCFRVKSKQRDDTQSGVFYDVFIFQADLTDVNADGLVNAANPNLHPGYVGDGISRRIREKAGKQMQDACKRIIKQDRQNELVQEGEVCFNCCGSSHNFYYREKEFS